MKHTTYPKEFSAMQTALKDYRQTLGKDTKPHHYGNEACLIKFAVTGNRQGCYLNLNSSRKMSRVIRRVICLNTQLIKLHVQYQDRKKSCRDFFLKATSVESQN